MTDQNITLDHIIDVARESFSDTYTAHDVGEIDPYALMHEIADDLTVSYVDELIRDGANSDLFMRTPELGPAFGGENTPYNIFAANLFEVIEEAIYEEWDRLKTDRYPDFEPAKIVNRGMGGFLYPPTHPAHDYSVRGEGFSQTLESAALASTLDPDVIEQAKELIENWTPLGLTAPEVQTWIQRVIRHFRHCYSDRVNWGKAGDLDIDRMVDPYLMAYRSAATLYIRRWYPHYQPRPVDFYRK